MTAAALNRLLGWDEKAIYLYIGKTKTPGLQRLKEISTALNISPSQLLKPADPLTVRAWRENHAMTRKELTEKGFLSTAGILALENADTPVTDLDTPLQELLHSLSEQN